MIAWNSNRIPSVNYKRINSFTILIYIPLNIIRKSSSIELLAIGIGQDVTRYYEKAIKIADVQDLGDVMINQLTDLVTEDKKKTIH